MTETPHSLRDWIDQKIEIALALSRGECGGSYAEAILILSAAISALAAEVWQGKDIDRKRFVEIIKDHCDPTLNPLRISIPLLIGHLDETDMLTEAELLQKQFLNFQKTRVITAAETDKSEQEIRQVCPQYNLQGDPKFSYANLLYEEVRSSYVHEYHSGAKADPWPHGSALGKGISYGNWAKDPHRHIHFPQPGWPMSQIRLRKAWSA